MWFMENKTKLRGGHTLPFIIILYSKFEENFKNNRNKQCFVYYNIKLHKILF